jgi:hypothetical protein
MLILASCIIKLNATRRASARGSSNYAIAAAAGSIAAANAAAFRNPTCCAALRSRAAIYATRAGFVI